MSQKNPFKTELAPPPKGKPFAKLTANPFQQGNKGFQSGKASHRQRKRARQQQQQQVQQQPQLHPQREVEALDVDKVFKDISPASEMPKETVTHMKMPTNRRPWIMAIFLLVLMVGATIKTLSKAHQTTAPTPKAPVQLAVTPVNATPAVASEPAAVGQKMYVMRPTLAVRDVPNGKVVGALKFNDAVTVSEVVGKWGKIGDNRFVGYRHLSPTALETAIPDAPVAASAAAANDTAPKSRAVRTRPGVPVLSQKSSSEFLERPIHPHVALQNIKVRGEPTASSSVVGYLRKGTVVSVFERQGPWLRIGQNQYVHAGNLTKLKMSGAVAQ